MSRRNSREGKLARRIERAVRPSEHHVTAGICRGSCGDLRTRTLIMPERFCIPCFNLLAHSLPNLHRVFG